MDLHQILSLGMVHAESGKEFYMEVRWSNITIAPEASRVHRLPLDQFDQLTEMRQPIGIVDQKASDWARTCMDGRVLKGVPLGWNVGNFDMPFVFAAMPQMKAVMGYRSIDLNALCFARDTAHGKSLGESKRWVKDRAGKSTHNALEDARAALACFNALVEEQRAYRNLAKVEFEQP